MNALPYWLFLKFAWPHPVSAGASSLKKMPRNLTLGGPNTVPDPLAAALRTPMCVRCVAATSAHQCHGDTPICSDTPYAPNTLPRRSLPATTSAASCPTHGLSTTTYAYVSHLPRTAASTAATLGDALASPSSRLDLPTVPRMIAGRACAVLLPALAAALAQSAVTTVPLSAPLPPPSTRPKSVARSPATRSTPGRSLGSTKMLGATPAATSASGTNVSAASLAENENRSVPGMTYAAAVRLNRSSWPTRSTATRPLVLCRPEYPMISSGDLGSREISRVRRSSASRSGLAIALSSTAVLPSTGKSRRAALHYVPSTWRLPASIPELKFSHHTERAAK